MITVKYAGKLHPSGNLQARERKAHWTIIQHSCCWKTEPPSIIWYWEVAAWALVLPHVLTVWFRGLFEANLAIYALLLNCVSEKKAVRTCKPSQYKHERRARNCLITQANLCYRTFPSTSWFVITSKRYQELFQTMTDLSSNAISIQKSYHWVYIPPTG